MSKPHKPRKEPHLRMEDLKNNVNPLQQKKWPLDEGDITQNQDHVEVPESEDAADTAPHPSYKELQHELTKAHAKIDEYRERQLRIEAEAENVRRRAELDVVKAHKYALESFIDDLLPVVDSLQRALQSDVHDNEYAQKIHAGIELTMSLLLKTLEKYGVKQVDPLEEAFDPEFHQAISTQPSDLPSNTVMEVLQKGFVLNDRLIRPALVVVAS